MSPLQSSLPYTFDRRQDAEEIQLYASQPHINNLVPQTYPPSARLASHQFETDTLGSRRDSSISIPRREQGGKIEVSRRRNKGRWSTSEDERLLKSIEKHGANKWKLVATDVESRNGDQCWKRWNDSLDPCLAHHPFTSSEDAILEAAVLRSGRLWSKIASENLPGRSGLSCKNRWDHIQRKQRRLHQSHREGLHSRSGTHFVFDKVFQGERRNYFTNPNQSSGLFGPLSFGEQTQRHLTGAQTWPMVPSDEIDNAQITRHHSNNTLNQTTASTCFAWSDDFRDSGVSSLARTSVSRGPYTYDNRQNSRSSHASPADSTDKRCHNEGHLLGPPRFFASSSGNRASSRSTGEGITDCSTIPLPPLAQCYTSWTAISHQDHAGETTNDARSKHLTERNFHTSPYRTARGVEPSTSVDFSVGHTRSAIFQCKEEQDIPASILDQRIVNQAEDQIEHQKNGSETDVVPLLTGGEYSPFGPLLDQPLTSWQRNTSQTTATVVPQQRRTAHSNPHSSWVTPHPFAQGGGNEVARLLPEEVLATQTDHSWYATQRPQEPSDVAQMTACQQDRPVQHSYVPETSTPLQRGTGNLFADDIQRSQQWLQVPSGFSFSIKQAQRETQPFQAPLSLLRRQTVTGQVQPTMRPRADIADTRDAREPRSVSEDGQRDCRSEFGQDIIGSSPGSVCSATKSEQSVGISSPSPPRSQSLKEEEISSSFFYEGSSSCSRYASSFLNARGAADDQDDEATSEEGEGGVNEFEGAYGSEQTVLSLTHSRSSVSTTLEPTIPNHQHRAGPIDVPSVFNDAHHQRRLHTSRKSFI